MSVKQLMTKHVDIHNLETQIISSELDIKDIIVIS